MAMTLRERVIERLQSLPDTQHTDRELAQWGAATCCPTTVVHVATEPPANGVRTVWHR